MLRESWREGVEHSGSHERLAFRIPSRLIANRSAKAIRKPWWGDDLGWLLGSGLGMQAVAAGL